MKKSFIYIFIAVAALLASACRNDALDPESVVKDSVNTETEFDRWLEENYRKPFNISFFYRYNDNEASLKYDLVPARELYCRILAKMVKYLWIEPYIEVADVDFMRSNAPRVMQVIGCGAYNSSGTITLGTAEGGQKITLYVGNWIERFITIDYNNSIDETDGYHIVPKDVDQLNYYYLKTIHHEFAHILNQKVTIPVEFRSINGGDYNSEWSSSTNPDDVAARNGFISRYASSAWGEDFAETFALYLTWTDEQMAYWLDLATEYNEDGSVKSTAGADKIRRKIEITKEYAASAWKLDMDALRTSIARRYADMDEIEWSDFSVSNN